MYTGVPSTSPACVRRPARPSNLAMPKSTSLATSPRSPCASPLPPSLARKMFSGLRSRCTIPEAWARERPSATCATMRWVVAASSRPRRVQPRRQVLADQELHRNERNAVPEIVVEHPDDVRALELGDGARLEREARGVVRLARGLGGHELHGAAHVERQVMREPHGPHGSAPQLAYELKAIGEDAADFGVQCVAPTRTCGCRKTVAADTTRPSGGASRVRARANENDGSLGGKRGDGAKGRASATGARRAIPRRAVRRRASGISPRCPRPAARPLRRRRAAGRTCR